MKSWKFRLSLGLAILILIFFYSNCGTMIDPSKEKSLTSKSTEVGNAYTATKIIDQMCEVLLVAHPELIFEECTEGLTNTRLSSPLGVPPHVYDPFRTLLDAENVGAVTADSVALDSCLTSIKNLDPNSTQVKAAYNSQIYDAYSDAQKMIPADNNCDKVYKKNQFTIPTPPQVTPGMTIVDFDFPEPAAPSPYLRGLYKGIDFGSDWGWHQAYNAATSNHLYFDQPVTKLNFNFSGGAKILQSLKLFTDSGSGLVTISDDQGQSVSLNISADLQMHLLNTGFTKASNSIFIEIPGVQFGIGIDDITYLTPVDAPQVFFLQSNSQMVTSPINELSFFTDVQAGSFVIVQATWFSDWSLRSVSDTQGNTFYALPRAASATGRMQQLWYFRPKVSGKNKIRVSYLDDGKSNYNGLNIYEYGGVAQTNPIGTNFIVTGAGSHMESRVFSTQTSHEMIFVGANSDTRPIVTFPDYTKRNLLIYALGVDRYVRNAGSYNFIAEREQNEQGWLLQVVTLRSK